MGQPLSKQPYAGESYQSPMLDHAKMKILRIIAQRMTENF